jgi:sugar lactone lactonase YvrE
MQFNNPSQTKMKTKNIMLKTVLTLGAIALLPTRAMANPGDIYVSDDSAIYQYTPTGAATVFASSLNAPRGLTFDNVGNLFVAIGGNGTVVKFAPDGTQSTVASNLGFAFGLAFDGVGNLYVSDAYGALYKIAPNGTVSTVFLANDYGTLQTHQFLGVAVDKTNNVYVADAVARSVYQFTPKGKQSIFASNIQPVGLTFDSMGNLLVATSYEDGDGSNGAGIPGGGKIIKISPGGKQTVVASGLGDLDLRGIAIDASGNIFVADHAFGNHGNPSTFNYNPIYSNVLKVNSGVASIFASGLNVAQFVAIQPAPTSFNVVATVPLQTNADVFVAANEVLNKIYTSGGASGGQHVVAIDGATFAATDVGTGSGASVDVQTSRYWAANVYGGAALVRDGNTNNVIATIALAYCPINTAYDSNRNRVWVGAQCGPGNDPVFAIDATTFNVIAGPISSGGVMGNIIANGATGRLYLDASGVSKRVDPTTFAVTTNAFGSVMAVNAITNRLYAAFGTNLQIINGATNPEKILKTVALSYTPASMAVNTALNHLYLVNPSAGSIEVRNGSTGASIATFSLGSFGATPNGTMAVDSTLGRIYAIAAGGSGPVLLVIRDLTTP